MSSTEAIPGQSAGGNLFGSYSPPAGVYDELFSAPDVARPGCEKFATAINLLGAEELSRRWEQADWLLHENGITYGAQGDSEARIRPWELDALPLYLPAAEWRPLSEALVQRARLLNLVLADLYGPQRLLSSGLLPAELMYSHPGYVRAYHGVRVPEEIYLHTYAADLARSAQGPWWVVADRTEAPSGAGYVLENRIVSSRMLSNIFRDCRVQRIASYFIALRELMLRLAPQHRENPRIVLLSQGPTSQTYFEDAYMARYLGYTLVEGGDLATRNDRVMLKTLGGLLPVDVILRRIDDDDCDPLELRGDSPLGVPGLLQSARSGHLAIANALGSALVESPAIMAYLPRMCRELLAEDLLLPSVATWWCGEADARRYVIEHLDSLVIRHAFRPRRREPIFGDRLTQVEKENLIASINAYPTQYVAQEQFARSTAPVWLRGDMRPWHVALRTYLVASGKTYLTMPGGLARVSPTADSLAASVSAGEASKDVWVQSEGPVRDVTLLQPLGQTIELRRSGAELPSRVADNLFWLGRHMERAEGAARLLRPVFLRLTSEADLASQLDLPALLRAIAEQGLIEPGFAVEGIRAQLPAIEQALPAAIFDASEPMSLRSTITNMHRVASIVRDRISLDTWRIINRIDQRFHISKADGFDLVAILGLLNRVVVDLAALSGLVAESMTRTQGWRLLDIGRRLERSLHTIGLVRSALLPQAGLEGPVLEASLEVADSLMTYRSRYLNNLQLPAVLDLLLTDETNPRSLAYQLAALCQHVEELPRDRSQALLSPEQRISQAALNSVRLMDADSLLNMQANQERVGLERLLARVAGQLPKLSDAITHKYLIHAGAPRQFSGLRP